MLCNIFWSTKRAILSDLYSVGILSLVPRGTWTSLHAYCVAKNMLLTEHNPKSLSVKSKGGHRYFVRWWLHCGIFFSWYIVTVTEVTITFQRSVHYPSRESNITPLPAITGNIVVLVNLLYSNDPNFVCFQQTVITNKPLILTSSPFRMFLLCF
jgi:hypothetical protein